MQTYLKVSLVILAVAFMVDISSAVQDNKCMQINCGRMWDPLCGTDGKTYPSQCILDQTNCQKSLAVKVAHQGECQAKEEKLEEAPATECPLMCPMIYAPLCGSDGKTYSNKCNLDSHNCRQKNAGATVTVARQGAC